MHLPRRLRVLCMVLMLPFACVPYASHGNTPQQPESARLRVEDGFVTAYDGARLFYQKVGSGSRTVIVPGRLFVFDDLRRFADKHVMIFYDMRNRGRSDSISDGERITIRDDVKDLESVRAHFKVDKASLIGYSYLGLMVVLYAMEHPDRVEGIIQLGPVPLKFGTDYPASLTPNDEKPVLDERELNALRKLRADGHHITNPKDYCEKEWSSSRYRLVGNPANVDRLGKGPCDMSNEWPVNLARHFQHHFKSVQELSVDRSEVSRVKTHVLTIHGTRDRNAVYGAGREWALLLPNARLVTVEGAAHQSWADEPELVFNGISTFLDGSWPDKAEKVTSLERTRR